MKTTPVPAALTATLLLVAGCGKPKNPAVPFNEDDLDGDVMEIRPAPEEIAIFQDEELENASFRDDSAIGVVKRELAEHGLTEGFSNGRIVMVAENSISISDPGSGGLFANVRNQCLSNALEEGKRKIMECISQNVDIGENETTLSVDGSLSGATVVLQAESWQEGKYQMAIAAVFSEKLAREMTDRVLNEQNDGKRGSGKPGRHSLREWLEMQDYSTMLGPRSMIDDEGVRHYLGIAAVDAGNGSSLQSKTAVASAQVLATKYATFSFPSHITAAITMKTSASGMENEGDSSISYHETLEAKPRSAPVVMSTEVVHPISGRKMAVIVVEAIP